MKPEDVGVGVVVRLSDYGRTCRLWGPHSEGTATIRKAELLDNGRGRLCVRVSVDGERKSRTRVMSLDYLELT